MTYDRETTGGRMDDAALLQRFVRERSEDAFNELTRRYLNVVYSSALRQTGDADLAEEVTQAVFIVLARKAEKLSATTVLPAWLLGTTRLLAKNACRDRNTRRRAESRSAAMQPANSEPRASDWDGIAPHLDDAIAVLNDGERSAVALRFFDQRPFREIGTTLGISTDAAEKRVSRALEKMRGFLVKRGVHLSVVVLATTLTQHAVQSAPAAVSASVPIAVAQAQAGLQLSSSTLANGAIKTMAMASTKKMAACAVVFLLFGLAGGWMVSSSFSKSTVEVTKPEPEPAAVFMEPVPRAVPAKTLSIPAAEVKTAPKPAAKRVNLLERIDADHDVVNGQWRIENGELVTDRTAFARVQLPYLPPEEYDLHVSFTVVEPRSEISLIGAKNGKQFVYRFGGEGNNLCSFEGIGAAGKDNATTRRIPNVLVAGKHYDLTLQVRDDSLAVFYGQQLLTKYNTNFAEIQFNKFWELDGRNEAIGVGGWGTVARFDAIEVIEVTGDGQFTRAPGEKAPKRFIPAPTPDDEWKSAVNLLALIKPERDTVTGTWKQTPEGLVCCKSPLARLEIPYEPPEEYDFKIVFSRWAGNEEITQILGKGGHAFQWMLSQRSGVVSFQLLNRWYEGSNPTTVPGGANIQWKQKMTSVIQVRKNYFAAFIDGKFVCQSNRAYDSLLMLRAWKMPTPGLLGLGSHNNDMTFHSAELLEITGKGAAVEAQTKRMPEPPAEPAAPPAKDPKPAPKAVKPPAPPPEF